MKKKKTKNIYCQKKNSIRKSSEYVGTLTNESLKNKESGRRNAAELELPKIHEKIYTEAIDISIKETEKNMKEQMINFQKLVKQVTQLDDNVLKQKIEKKEMVRMIKNEIIQLEDLPYEKAIREEEKKKILEKDSIKNVKKKNRTKI